MRTLHQILLLGAALLWAAGHVRAGTPEHGQVMAAPHGVHVVLAASGS